MAGSGMKEAQVSRERIIDADVHVEPPVEKILPYVENDRIAAKLEDIGYPTPDLQWFSTYATKDEGSGIRTQGRAIDGHDIVEAMDEVGSDVVMVTFGRNGLPSTQNPRIRDEICRAYNNYLLEEVTSVDEGVKAMAAIPQWDPDVAVAELDRIGEADDIVGAYGWVGSFDLLGEPKFDPVYKKLVELDLPLSLHASTSYWPRSNPVGEGIRTWTELFGVAPAAYAMMHTANMILTGVFDKFPELNIVYKEAGFNWIPFLAYRLDEFYLDHPEDIQLTERMFDGDRTYLDRKPSEYLFSQFSFATQPVCRPDNSARFESLLDLCRAEETLIYSSDWPHHTFDPPRWTADLDDETRKRILHGNAESVYRI